MLQRIFGRKPATPTTVAWAPPLPANAADAFLHLHEPDHPEYIRYRSGNLTSRQGCWVASGKEFERLSLAERSEIFCSLLDGPVALDAEPEKGSREEALKARFVSLLERAIRLDLEENEKVFQAGAWILGKTSLFDYSHHASAPLFRCLARIHKSGHQPTAEQKRWLMAYAGKLEALSPMRSLKEEKKAIASMVASLQAMSGAVPAASDRVAILAAPLPSPFAFQPEPPNFAFWIAFLKRASAELEIITQEILSKRPPSWMQDASAFAERFPEFGPHPLKYGFWEESWMKGWGDERPLPGVRFWAAKGDRPAPPSVYDTAVAAPASLSTLVNLVWNKDSVPALERLLDLRDPAQAEMLLHMAESKPGPRPSPAWTKKSKALIDRIGREAFETGLFRWLGGFHDPAPSAARQAQAWNHHVLMHAARTLEESDSDLVRQDDASIGKAAASFALAATISHHGNRSFLTVDGGNGGSRLLLWEVGRRGEPGAVNAGALAEELQPSLTNEAMLRSACWLVADFPAPGRIVVLESCVASALVESPSNQGVRSRSTANAAIASLGSIGSHEAMVALGRIRRSVRDKAIARSVGTAIDALAAKLGVDSDDVEEMSVPDYGFD